MMEGAFAYLYLFHLNFISVSWYIDLTNLGQNIKHMNDLHGDRRDIDQCFLSPL